MTTTTAEKFTHVAHDNVSALTKSGNASAAGLGKIGKACQDMAARNSAHMAASVKALSSVKTLTEFFDVEHKQAMEGFELAVVNTRAMAELGHSVFASAFAPMEKRIATIENTVKSQMPNH